MSKYGKSISLYSNNVIAGGTIRSPYGNNGIEDGYIINRDGNIIIAVAKIILTGAEI